MTPLAQGASPPPGRNAACPCGSGRKYKHCCALKSAQPGDFAAADPEPQARALVAALGLGWEAACLRPEQNRRVVKTSSAWQVRQPIYSVSVERWRRYEPWLGPLRELALD